MRALVAVGLTAVLVAVGLTVPTAPAEAFVGVTIQGRGYGHGIGMSQYGAKGRAEAGQTYAQILAAYYSGTTPAVDNDATPITVWIKEDTDNNETWVIAEPNMVLQGSNPELGTSASAAPVPETIAGPGSVQVTPTAWRLRLVSRTFVLEGYYRGSWYPNGSDAITTTLSNQNRATFTAADGTVRIIVGSTYREHRAAVSANRIPGTSPPVVRTTVTLPMGEYLKSVVKAEMPASWSAAAVQAQAVAARTYASYDRDVASRPWWYDTCNSTSCQVYKGVGDYTGAGVLVTSFEHPLATAAVAATADRILTWGGRPAFTQFSASNGGYSVTGSQPYLAAQSDPFDAYPTWTVTLSAATISAAYPTIGAFTSLAVLARDGNGSWGGRVTSVRITGTAGSVTVAGTAFRTALGLKSTLWIPTSVHAPVQAPQRDWNSDGGSDLIGRAPDGKLYLFPGLPGATWARRAQIGKGWNTMRLMTQVFNFGGTHRPEIITTDQQGLLYLYPGDGRGSFTASVRLGQGWWGFDMLIGTDGWHASGQPGLLARKAATGQLLYYPGTGAGGFGATRDLGTGWNDYDALLVAGDWDGDGHPDLMGREAATGDLYLWRGDGSGGFLGSMEIGHGWGGMDEIVGAGDWDRDGQYDVIAREDTTGALWLYPGDGIGGFLAPRQVGNGWVGFTLVK